MLSLSCRSFTLGWPAAVFYVFLQWCIRQQLFIGGCSARRRVLDVDVNCIRFVWTATAKTATRRRTLRDSRCDQIAVFGRVRPEVSSSTDVSRMFAVVGGANLTQFDEPHDATVADAWRHGHLRHWRHADIDVVTAMCRLQPVECVLVVVDDAVVSQPHWNAVLRLRAAVCLPESNIGVGQRHWCRHRVVVATCRCVC